MLKNNPSVVAYDPEPAVEVAEDDALEVVDVVLEVVVVALVVALLLVGDAVVETTEELNEAANVTTDASELELALEIEELETEELEIEELERFLQLPPLDELPEALGPARNSRGCKETTDVALDDVVAEVAVAEAVPGTHW